ncbi:spliceosome-associated protein [Theileria orientalis]|uniref:Spliceosome-associated protein n=1 Tax=Theileria orientalis TaxID=68886 RepID=A0A976M5P0_THEOR|nr:spliceosome-associated protein [Theileria orientalis]
MANKIDLSTVKSIRKKNPATYKNLVKKLKRKQKQNHTKESNDGVKTNGQVLKEALKTHFKDFEEHLKDSEDVEIEYIYKDEDVGEFGDVFEKFSEMENQKVEEEPQPEVEEPVEEQFDDTDSEEDESHKKMSTKKLLRLMNRPTLSQLKQYADKPEVVEIWDTTAADPKFLVWLKGQRNTIPVPSHWSEKTRFMQNRRSSDKPPYKLPPHIEATKISEIRSALQIKESEKTLKQKQREKARPKSHRMDIDYQTLHDAFFKYAVKPPMTKYGDVYYEGKEMVLRMRNCKPGQLSERLKHALGIGENAPPPWLINMQRFGPPPSYPNLRIPGVNAPLPESASFGYQPGGWGHLPTDEAGNPLYGYFDSSYYEDNHIDKTFFGEVAQAPEEEEDEEESDEEAGDEGKTDQLTSETPLSMGMKTPLVDVGLSALDTPMQSTMQSTQAPRKAYTVLEPKVATASNALFGSQITYQMPPPVATPLGMGGMTTPMGGIATPSLTTEEIDGTTTTDEIMRQLKYHENKAKKAHEAAGQIEVQENKDPNKKKKKKQFKF